MNEDELRAELRLVAEVVPVDAAGGRLAVDRLVRRRRRRVAITAAVSGIGLLAGGASMAQAAWGDRTIDVVSDGGGASGTTTQPEVVGLLYLLPSELPAGMEVVAVAPSGTVSASVGIPGSPTQATGPDVRSIYVGEPRAARGFGLVIDEPIGDSDGSELSLPGARPVEVRGHRAVLSAQTFGILGATFSPANAFLATPDLVLRWHEGPSIVSLWGVGMSDVELLAVAASLREVDASAWEGPPLHTTASPEQCETDGEPAVDVPNVVGRSLAEAVIVSHEVGLLVVGTGVPDGDPNALESIVVAQEPPAGSRVVGGSCIGFRTEPAPTATTAGGGG